MKFTAKQYAQALHGALVETQPKDLDLVLDNFVKLLAENNDLRLFDQIASELHKNDLEKKGIKQAEVASAHPLNHENERHILEVLNRYVKSKVELKKKLDENIVGGAVIQVDDLMIDASVRKSLEQLKKSIES